MKYYNLNNDIIIYPIDEGWDKMIQILQDQFRFSYKDAVKYIEEGKTKDGGFKGCGWELIQYFGSLHRPMSKDITAVIGIKEKKLRDKDPHTEQYESYRS